MRFTVGRSLGLGAVAIACMVSVTAAIERTRLPAFTTLDDRGREISSESLERPGAWVIVVVRPGCTVCDTVLRAVNDADASVAPERLVVIVSGAAARDLPGEIERVPHLANAKWLADPAGSTDVALRLTGVPSMFGMRGQMIEWTLAGVLLRADDIRSVLAAWMAKG
jgi:hypothetical protein